MSTSTWAPSGKPLSLANKYASGKYVCVIAAISAEEGLVHYQVKYCTYNSEDVGEFLIRLRAKLGQ
jgi:hypothetical protein